jgi:katanin p60 ATPase-containing subunit A1
MAPSTIFFDEIDSLASQRGTANENEISRRMKAQLLTKMEGIDSSSDSSALFVLAATNFPWDLDEALLRRFQKRVYIPLPDRPGRIALLKMHLDEIIDERFDIEKWADHLDGYSCADIANLCRDAAQKVFQRQMELLNTEQWVNMPVQEAQVIVKDADFAWAMTKRKSSVNHANLRRYQEWKDARGAE